MDILLNLISMAIGAFMTYFAVKATAAETRKIEKDKRMEDLVLHLMRDIDEYVASSFRDKGRQEQIEHLQKIARRLCTSAFLCVSEEKLKDIRNVIQEVEKYHYTYRQTQIGQGTNFGKVNMFFEDLKRDLAYEYFKVDLPAIVTENA